MKQYSIIHIPVLSFFSKTLYRDVCTQWKGTGFAYLLLLLAVCWIPAVVRMHVGLSGFIDNDAPKIVTQIPKVSIVNGKASIEEPQPYYIRVPETDKALVVIDTTGKITSLADTDALGLVTKTEVIFKENQIETRTFSFKKIKSFTLDQNRITAWLATAKKFAAIVFYPQVLLGSFAVRIIQLLLYAVIGMLFSSLCKCKRKYVELLRLSVVAVTPCIIIKTILGIAEISVPVAGLWYFLITMVYLFFGVKAASMEENPTSESTLSHVPREG